MNADQITLTETQKTNIAALAGDSKISPEQFVASMVENSMKQRENMWMYKKFQTAKPEIRQAVIDILK
jgi:hypothetical protein